MAVIISTAFIGLPPAPPTEIGGTHSLVLNVENELPLSSHVVGIFQNEPANTAKLLVLNVENELPLSSHVVGIFQNEPANTAKLLTMSASGP